MSTHTFRTRFTQGPRARNRLRNALHEPALDEKAERQLDLLLGHLEAHGYRLKAGIETEDFFFPPTQKVFEHLEQFCRNHHIPLPNTDWAARQFGVKGEISKKDWSEMGQAMVGYDPSDPDYRVWNTWLDEWMKALDAEPGIARRIGLRNTFRETVLRYVSDESAEMRESVEGFIRTVLGSALIEGHKPLARRVETVENQKDSIDVLEAAFTHIKPLWREWQKANTVMEFLNSDASRRLTRIARHMTALPDRVFANPDISRLWNVEANEDLAQKMLDRAQSVMEKTENDTHALRRAFGLYVVSEAFRYGGLRDVSAETVFRDALLEGILTSHQAEVLAGEYGEPLMEALVADGGRSFLHYYSSGAILGNIVSIFSAQKLELAYRLSEQVDALGLTPAGFYELLWPAAGQEGPEGDLSKPVPDHIRDDPYMTLAYLWIRTQPGFNPPPEDWNGILEGLRTAGAFPEGVYEPLRALHDGDPSAFAREAQLKLCLYMVLLDPYGVSETLGRLAAQEPAHQENLRNWQQIFLITQALEKEMVIADQGSLEGRLADDDWMTQAFHAIRSELKGQERAFPRHIVPEGGSAYRWESLTDAMPVDVLAKHYYTGQEVLHHAYQALGYYNPKKEEVGARYSHTHMSLDYRAANDRYVPFYDAEYGEDALKRHADHVIAVLPELMTVFRQDDASYFVPLANEASDEKYDDVSETGHFLLHEDGTVKTVEYPVRLISYLRHADHYAPAKKHLEFRPSFTVGNRKLSLLGAVASMVYALEKDGLIPPFGGEATTADPHDSMPKNLREATANAARSATAARLLGPVHAHVQGLHARYLREAGISQAIGI